MNKRIKKIRRDFDLTQEKFGARIGVKGNTVAQWESGRNNPPDSAIAFICNEFGIMDEWLRTGLGPMYAPEATSELDALAKRYKLKHKDYVFIEKLCKDEEMRTKLEDWCIEYALSVLQDDVDMNAPACGAGDLNPYSDIPDSPEELERKFPPIEDQEKKEGGLG